MRFRNREEAAHLLAKRLADYRGKKPLVLAIPRGAAVMARIIADELKGEADVVLVRKLGAPGQSELAIGSIDEQGHLFLTNYARQLGVSDEYLAREKAKQLQVLNERRRMYTAAKEPISFAGRIVIVVDDGIATGSTMIAALKSIRQKKPSKLIAATAVAPAENVDRIRPFADDVVCLATPPEFYAVGQFFEDFRQVEDEEVIEILKGESLPADPEVTIFADGKKLKGNLTMPTKRIGIVIFAHGSGSSRLSVRNQYVASVLQKKGIGTLLFDLMTVEEDEIYENRFDIPLLARRLMEATSWLQKRSEASSLPIGYFGASTGAAAALIAAAELGKQISSVVSRGGRPDLAMEVLDRVTAPTLLLVGGRDDIVIGMNQRAHDSLKTKKKLSIVPGATHLFEEPGTLEEVARQAAEWFSEHMR